MNVVDLPGGTEPDLQGLHDRLAAGASAAGLLDVAYRTVDTPIGRVLLATTPTGLARVAFEGEGFDEVLGRLAERISPRILEVPSRLDAAARQMDEYFAGRRHRFDLPLDLVLAAGFRRTVLDYLPSITYGRTASYAAVAAAVDHPRAVRAVGTACARNPLPLIIPCHRVVRSDGAIGAYLAGAAVKKRLLDMEGAA